MWQSHRPGINVLPRPSITCAPAGTLTDARAPTAVITPLSTTTVWSVRNRSRVGVEEPDTGECHRSRGHRDQRFGQPRRLRRHRSRLRFFDLRLFAGIRVRQPGDPERHGEELVVRVRPDRQRRGADAGDRPERDGLPRRAGADLEIDQFGCARLAAGQQVERFVRPRQQRLQEPRRRVDRSALRDVERGRRIARGTGVDRALPTCRPAADREGLCRVALRRHAADRDR